MGMTGGSGRGGPTWQINVTPMIDVLLVLLIIFMVIQPTLQKGLEVQVPPVEKSNSADDSPDQIVLEVRRGPTYLVNEIPVSGSLEAYIRQLYANRPRKVLFIRGGTDLVYGDVVRAVDAARGAGVEVVGLVPRGD
ncbi:MAG TPA: biopolymer transporter ExbD [Longimicrobiales bacterium]|nr:biopolymer transporter ExbD [Longimicrobiales bacterium]